MTFFSLLQAVASVPPAEPDPLAWQNLLGEYLKFAGYFLAIGAAGYRYFILPRFDPSHSQGAVFGRTSAATLGLGGVLLLLLSALGGIELNAILHDRSFSDSLPKSIGRLQFRIAALAVALSGYAVARRASARIGWPIASVAILAAVLQPVVTSQRLAGKVNAVHILAASTWLGTLAVMLLAGIRSLMRAPAEGASRQRAAANIVNAFTPVALTAATVLALSGVTTAWLHLKRPPALWQTDYGRALIFKLCLVLLVAASGWWNWKRLKPSMAGDEGSVARLNRSAIAELAFAAAVLAATAVLVSLPSPK